jgi:hypothetical protein
MNSKGKFSLKKFRQINNDEVLISEILIWFRHKINT